MKNKILETIYWLLFLFVVAVALIPTLSTLNVPLPFKLYAVQTGSMEPTIKVGDLILVKAQEQYRAGDIITFTGGEGGSQATITHRIERVNTDGTFTTKGDANSAVDVDPVSQENIIGRYFFRIPFFGYPINFVRTPVGFLVLIVIPAVIIVYEEIKKIKNTIASRRRPKVENPFQKEYQK